MWRVVCWATPQSAPACSSPYRSSPATTARSTPPYRTVSTCCRGKSCCALWTTSTESTHSLLTAELDWTLQYLHLIVTPSPRSPPIQPHPTPLCFPFYLCIWMNLTIVWLPFVHIMWYLQHSTETNAIAVSEFWCKGFRHREMSQCCFFLFVLFSLSSGGVSQHTAPRQMTLFQQVTTEPGATASSVL